MLLIKNAKVYSPEYLGVKDVLTAGGNICCIRDHIELGDNLPVEIIDARDNVLLPGFIDNHVHILGAGREGSAALRLHLLHIQ